MALKLNEKMERKVDLKEVSQGKIQDFMSTSVLFKTWNLGVEKAVTK